MLRSAAGNLDAIPVVQATEHCAAQPFASSYSMSSARADCGSAYTVVARDEEMADGSPSALVHVPHEERRLLVVSEPCPVRVKVKATDVAAVVKAVWGKLGIGADEEADVLFFEPALKEYVLLDESSFPDMPVTAKIKVERPQRSKRCCSCSCGESTDSAEMQPLQDGAGELPSDAGDIGPQRAKTDATDSHWSARQQRKSCAEALGGLWQDARSDVKSDLFDRSNEQTRVLHVALGLQVVCAALIIAIGGWAALLGGGGVACCSLGATALVVYNRYRFFVFGHGDVTALLA